jgi:integrase
LASKSRSVRIEKRTLADGTVKEYRYQRRQRITLRGQTVAAAIAAWQNSPEWSILKPATVSSYVTYIHPFFQALQHAHLKQVRRRHIMVIRDTIAKQRGHGAAIGFCRAVSAFYKFALDRDLVESSPATQLRRSLRSGTFPTWTQDQALRAIRDLPEYFRRTVVLAYHTGQRRGDLCAMRWSDLVRDRLLVKQEKTGATLEIPISRELAVELAAWRSTTRTVTILETPSGRPWVPNDLTRLLRLELTKIGLPARLNIHGLRKLMATRLADHGSTTHEIAAITGHKTLAMVQLYANKANQRTLADVAMLRLDPKAKRDKSGKE